MAQTDPPRLWKQPTPTMIGAVTASRSTNKNMKKRIPLVEGEMNTRESLLRALVSENYQVVSAANAREVLALADGTLVDLVLLNLQMLVQNGWELFEWLVREHPRLPVLFITPHSIRTRGAQIGNRETKGTKTAATTLLQTVRDLLSEPAQVCLARMSQKLGGSSSHEKTLLSLQPSL
jgi:CheY-like chemotaxis protein